MSAGILESLTWKESSVPPDSSGSETGKETPPEGVHFIIGEGNEDTPKYNPREKIQGSTHMVRSYSQDTNMVLNEPTASSFLSKTSFSDNSLDTAEKLNTRINTVKKSLKDLPTVMSVDDETLSTDSNSTADNDEIKRRRRKIHFPFKKNKIKLT